MSSKRLLKVVSEQLGFEVSYQQLRRALAEKAIKPVGRCGRVLLFDDPAVDDLSSYIRERSTRYLYATESVA